jgi:hypothetical protein
MFDGNTYICNINISEHTGMHSIKTERYYVFRLLGCPSYFQANSGTVTPHNKTHFLLFHFENIALHDHFKLTPSALKLCKIYTLDRGAGNLCMVAI